MSRNAKNGPSQRQLRVGEQARHALAEVMQRDELRDPEIEGVVVSVSEVRMSPDLKIATAYVSPLGEANGEVVVAALNRNARYIRGRVTPALKQMKFVPELRFRLDTSFDNFERIEQILRSPEVARDLDQEGDGEEDK